MDHHKSVQILDKSSLKVLINLPPLLEKLLSYLPEEHLEGLESIVLVDRLLGTKHKDDAYLYRKQSKSPPANIELSLNGIYKNFPKAISFIPLLRKAFPTLGLYQAVGEHYMHLKGNVHKNERQAFIKEYPKPYIRRALPYNVKILKFIRPAFRWFSKQIAK